MLAQWRARIGPSQRIAARLGYQVLGEQVSLRLATDATAAAQDEAPE
jgi:hypothetical protein